MSTKTKTIKTIDLTPTWVSAVRIYISCLENPNAGRNAKRAARDDLLSLAKAMDRIKEQSTVDDVEFTLRDYK